MAWVAVENFNSYSDGDLNGNNGGSGWSAAWSGGTSYDIQGTSTYEGAKAVTGINANQNIIRTLSAGVVSGEMYVAMRVDSIASGQDSNFDLMSDDGATLLLRLSMRESTGNKIQVLGGVTTTLLNGFSTSQWYVFHVKLNGDDTADVRYHDGSSWSSWSTNLAYSTSDPGGVDTVRLNSSSNITVYWDYISPTNPITTAYTLTADTASYVLTGIDVALSSTASPYTPASRNTTSFAAGSRNTTSHSTAARNTTSMSTVSRETTTHTPENRNTTNYSAGTRN